jgi:hypothetical protein
MSIITSKLPDTPIGIFLLRKFLKENVLFEDIQPKRADCRATPELAIKHAKQKISDLGFTIVDEFNCTRAEKTHRYEINFVKTACEDDNQRWAYRFRIWKEGVQ